MGFAGEIKRVAFDFQNEGSNEIVAGIGEKKLQVLALVAVPNANMAVRLDSAGGRELTGIMHLGAKDPLVLPYNPAAWVETDEGEGLNLETSGAQRVAGCLSYVEV